MIGIFGGTFDPLHFGHLRPVGELAAALPFEEIRFIPCRVPPHRPRPEATPEQRWYMLTRVVGRTPGLVADDRELRREGVSYTIDTLEGLRRELGPDKPLGLIMGSDAFASLDTWHRWRDIPGLAHIVVMRRPGAELPVRGAVADFLEGARVDDPAALSRRPAGGVFVQDVSPQEVSSTAVRECIREGRQPRFMLPGSIWSYIRRTGLYLGNDPNSGTDD
jgi:nicotinate-nucleotide adenylyltransferase